MVDLKAQLEGLVQALYNAQIVTFSWQPNNNFILTIGEYANIFVKFELLETNERTKYMEDIFVIDYDSETRQAAMKITVYYKPLNQVNQSIIIYKVKGESAECTEFDFITGVCSPYVPEPSQIHKPPVSPGL